MDRTLKRSVGLTDVDYKQGEMNKDLLEQMTEALKKFVAKALVDTEKREGATMMTSDNLKQVLIAKGWKKPQQDNKKKEVRGERPSI